MKDEFFLENNTINEVTENELNKSFDYKEAIYAFERITYASIYIIDYHKQAFEYVSDNPLFLCGHSVDEVREMGYAFYFKNVLPEDLEMLIKINKVGFDFY